MSPTVPVERLLTVKEVAEALRLSMSGIYNLLAAGEIPYGNLAIEGRQVPRIRQADLDSFIDGRTHKTSQATAATAY